MLRLFSAFPNGRPGVGLLILRLAAGLVVVVRGMNDISSQLDWEGSLGVASVAGGALLLAGFLTPLAAVWVAGALALSRASSTSEGFISLSALLLLSQCASLALIGPGAWSLDAKLFGRREILIPRQSDHKLD